MQKANKFKAVPLRVNQKRGRSDSQSGEREVYSDI